MFVCIGNAAAYSSLLTSHYVIAFLKASLSYHFRTQLCHIQTVGNRVSCILQQMEDKEILLVLICQDATCQGRRRQIVKRVEGVSNKSQPQYLYLSTL